MSNREDIVGKRTHMLTVIKRLPNSKVICCCDCGNEKTLYVGHFNSGKMKSCGCHVNRHGHGGNGKRSREYVCYYNMLNRCHNQSNKRFTDYGGKGIIVCDRWRYSFINFINDMGLCPEGYTIDRIDNNKGYYPENCEWVSRRKNQQNRSLSLRYIVKGKTFNTAKEAAEYFNVSRATISAWCRGRTSESRYYPPREDCGFIEVYPK